MTLIIRDQLVNPPTWFASFRDLTLYCHIFLRDDVVIESDDIDTYYRWIKPRGGMDFNCTWTARAFGMRPRRRASPRSNGQRPSIR